jgi:hypothetical protein
MRVATPANEALLLDYARLMTASQLEKLCRKYALVQRHGPAQHPVSDEQHRYARRRGTDDGMVKIEAVLHPEEAELVWTMLNHAATQLAGVPDACSHDDSAESRVAPAPRIGVTPLLQQVAGHECDDSAESHVTTSVSGTTAISVPGHTKGRRVDDSAESRAVPSASATTTTTAGHIDPCSIGDSAESRQETSSLAEITAVSPGPSRRLGATIPRNRGT